jgi:hypothetical protein
MRKTFAVLAVVGLAATMSVALAAPASAKGGPPKPPPKESKCSKSSQKGILFSWKQFLVAPTAAGKTAYIDQGSLLTSIVDQSNAAALKLGLLKPGQNTIPFGLMSTCTGKASATFVFDLQFQDVATATTAPPLGLHISGRAVLKKGHWLIAGSTVCDLTQLESAQFGGQCYQAIGLPVPPAS